MATTIESRVTAPPRALSAAAPYRLLPAGGSLWRVVDARGLVIGHIQEFTDGGDTRFRARRYRPASRSFLELGDFWSREQAVECLRFTR
ncbi:hypothetical protein [Microbacterium sp. Root61]|uniref:hypothetical protein n=1 Tax=Microbacterium sp. Root61 TaxID=1736570 RepID=UPI000A68A6FB|nr:hypothetical protein [Microbacterium sp. Root61]